MEDTVTIAKRKRAAGAVRPVPGLRLRHKTRG